MGPPSRSRRLGAISIPSQLLKRFTGPHTDRHAGEPLTQTIGREAGGFRSRGSRRGWGRPPARSRNNARAGFVVPPPYRLPRTVVGGCLRARIASRAACRSKRSRAKLLSGRGQGDNAVASYETDAAAILLVAG